MTKAPEVIVASVQPERLYGKSVRMPCVTVGADGVPDPFEPTHYVMKDTHDALVKAADELEEALDRISKTTSPAKWDANLIQCIAINALAAYRNTRGGEKKTNWRDDPEAIVEDDEPMIGRDYE